MEEGMKKCPACAEYIKEEAKKCRYCGEDFERTKANEMEKASEESKKNKGNLIKWVFVILFFFMVWHCAMQPPSKGTVTSKSIQSQCNGWYNAPKVCSWISSWDWSHPKINKYIQDSLKNPSSFEHIETIIWDSSKDSDRVSFKVSYYWNNSYWAKTKENMVLYMNKESLSISLKD